MEKQKQKQLKNTKLPEPVMHRLEIEQDDYVHLVLLNKELQPHGSTMKTRRRRSPSHAGNEAQKTPSKTFYQTTFEFWDNPENYENKT